MRGRIGVGSVVMLGALLAAPAVAAAQEASGSVSTGGGVRSSSSGGARLGIQGRLDALNVLGGDDADLIGNAGPLATPGLRLVDGKLYVGVGFGFFGVEDGEDGFSIHPLASFDLLSDDVAALSLVGWLSMGDYEGFGIGGDTFFFGGSVGLGARGKISDGLAIGSEWGWGFLSLDVDRPMDDDEQIFVHGVFGTILFEATVGL